MKTANLFHILVGFGIVIMVVLLQGQWDHADRMDGRSLAVERNKDLKAYIDTHTANRWTASDHAAFVKDLNARLDRIERRLPTTQP